MKTIPVFFKSKQVAVTFVDDKDYDLLSRYHWTLQSHGYVRTYIEGKAVYMHRMIVGGEKEIDHINRNKRDNRRLNLRFCTRSQNNANKRKESGFVGIRWEQDRRKWLARIGYNGRTINLGRYEDEREAALAYDKAAKEYFGDFAQLNFSREGR